MYTGLLKQFLKKLTGFIVDTGNPVGSHKSNLQSGSKNSSLKLTTTVLLSIIGCATAFPAMAVLTIDSASWSSKNGTLTVKGNNGKSDLIRVWNSYADPVQDIGTVTAKGNGGWQLKTKKNSPPNPVPCAVSATIVATGETTGPVAVTGISSPDCAPPPPVAQNCTISVNPTALNFGDVQIGTTSAPQTTTVSNSGGADCTVTVTQTGSVNFLAAPLSFIVAPASSQDVTVDYTPDVVGADSGNLAVGSNDPNTPNVDVVLSGNGVDNQGGDSPNARPDTYGTPFGNTLNVTASRISGVLHNDEDPQDQALTAVLVSGTTNGTLNLNADGSFDYTPNQGVTENSNDSFTYQAQDIDLNLSQVATVNIHIESNQTDFKIMMNYELGMHCTGFEFAYCCVLPVYNSILAQVVKPNSTGQGFPELLEGDPNVGRDFLGRETVVRDKAQDGNGNFRKYVVKYWHDAQPRMEGNGKAQASTLISGVEGNSLMAWNTTYDGAALDVNGALVTGLYNGADGVMLGNGTLGEGGDNYQNAVWNHLYIFNDPNNPTPAGPNLEGHNSTGTSLEIDKIRLGVNGQVVFPADCGPALHPMGPVTQGGDPSNPVVANDCAGFSNGNVLTFSGDTGTVVFTQMKVLENLPITLTSPRIWEALGLPLTTFEDTIDFFADPGLVDEDSVRPFVAMKAQMYDYDPNALDGTGAGAATLNGDGTPVIGHGTAPIDIPNCERCHSNPVDGTLIANSAAEGGGMLTVVNSPNDADQSVFVKQEYDFWNAFYSIDPAAGDSDWYSRLKSAAISILKGHDAEHGTSFALNYPGDDVPGELVQNTRLGKESVICARCHAQNVIAAVKSANCSASNPTCAGDLIMPITEALHYNHRSIAAGGVIAFADAQGRAGGCQGCHPAHRSDGNMNGYPITLAGANKQASSDNREADGGCFVGRDVHSNPGKDTDGAETPEHLNAVGQWLSTNVYSDTAADGSDLGIWCTNCHNQLGQELWKTENMTSNVHNTGTSNPRAEPTLAAVAAAVGTTEAQAMSWLDPKNSDPLGDNSFAIWAPDPGLCNYVAGYFGVIPVDPAHDGNVATVEVNVNSAAACSTGGGSDLINCGAAYPGAPAFHICGTVDGDGDFSVNAMDFCTTPDCVAAAQATLGDPAVTGSVAVPVPMSAATDGRDHWLAPGEPHCADCHAAPYTEQSGHINPYPPFNYPRKASLMRYSRGHQDITCQGCHESIHGLYPVTPAIDNTSYAQAAALNHDGSHGPIKCGACHDVGADGIPTFLDTSQGNVYGITDYDSAVGWAHEYTDERSVLDTTCQNCHGVQGTNWSEVNIDNGTYMEHASRNNPRGSRQMMDKAEIELTGAVFTSTDGSDGACLGCHGDESGNVSCTNGEWLNHLTEGRVAAEAFEHASTAQTGGTCW